jgi:hypothetical protein
VVVVRALTQWHAPETALQFVMLWLRLCVCGGLCAFHATRPTRGTRPDYRPVKGIYAPAQKMNQSEKSGLRLAIHHPAVSAFAALQF